MSKFSVKINYLDDIRRFSLQEGVTWESVSKTIQNIFPTIEEWQNIQIVYQDDEGDLVLLSSDDEFKEALFQLGNEKRILRLHIQKKVAPSNEKPEYQRRCGRKMEGRGQFYYNRLNRRALQLMDGSVGDLEKAKRLLSRARSIRPSECIPVYNIACVEALLGNKDAALQVLEESIKLGYEDVNHIEKDEDLKSLRETDKFKEIVSSLNKKKAQNPSPQNSYFDLQKNIFSLFNSGTREALETARQLLFSQVNLRPQDPISAYNLACVEALLNNPQLALTHLQNSINLGFKNLSHILKDKDLKSLHPLEAFQSLITSLGAESTFKSFNESFTQAKGEQPSPSQPQSTIPEPVVIAPVPVSKPEPVVIAPPVIPPPVVVPAPEPELEKGMLLLQEMGFTDIRANLIALKKAGGNFDNAISDLLDQF